MNQGQARVLLLLLLLLGLESIKQPAVHVFMANVRASVTGNVQAAANSQSTTPLSINPKTMLYWLFAALALLALAGPAPDVATGLVLLLILAVLLSDATVYADLLTPPGAKKS